MPSRSWFKSSRPPQSSSPNRDYPDLPSPRQELVFTAHFPPPPSPGYASTTFHDADPHAAYLDHSELQADPYVQPLPTPEHYSQGSGPTFNVTAPESPSDQSVYSDSSQLQAQYQPARPGSGQASSPPSHAAPDAKKSIRSKLGISPHTTDARDDLRGARRLQKRPSLHVKRTSSSGQHYFTPQSTPLSPHPPSGQWHLASSPTYPVASTSEEAEQRPAQLYNLHREQASPYTSANEPQLALPGKGGSQYQAAPRAAYFPAQHLHIALGDIAPNEAGVSPLPHTGPPPDWHSQSPHHSNNSSRPPSRHLLEAAPQFQIYSQEVTPRISSEAEYFAAKQQHPHPQEPGQGDPSEERMAPSGNPRPQRFNTPQEFNRHPPPLREGANMPHARGEPDAAQQQQQLQPQAPQPPQHSNSAVSAASPQPAPGRSQVAQVAQQTDGGRGTPPLRQASDMSEQELNQLIKDYKELREKYSKVKKYYFEKDSQVQVLQNTLAHQRLSQSRTSLDDSEYVARLNRLDGLISQLAFVIRKDWMIIPPWLHHSVNKEAVTTGKHEMTAVGRAVISKWMADELFDKYFHPNLELLLSTELKTVQRNIRKFAPPYQSGEEEEALAAKIINWRLATVDGLQTKLNSPVASDRRKILIEELNEKLVESIKEYMHDPPPAELEGGVHMIIEVAVGILANLPLESRDVHIEYFQPGIAVNENLMKVETGVPPLVNAIVSDNDDNDKSSQESFDEGKDGLIDGADGAAHEHAKKAFLGGVLNRKPGHPPAAAANADDSNSKVRMCVFLVLQIRGKTVLSKAPVFGM